MADEENCNGKKKIAKGPSKAPFHGKAALLVKCLPGPHQRTRRFVWHIMRSHFNIVSYILHFIYLYLLLIIYLLLIYYYYLLFIIYYYYYNL